MPNRIFRDFQFKSIPLVDRERNKLGLILDKIKKVKDTLPYEDRLKDWEYKSIHLEADKIIKNILNYG